MQWRGFDSYSNSWQRPEDLTGCASELRQYWSRQRSQQKQAAAQHREERQRQREQRAEAKQQREAKKAHAAGDQSTHAAAAAAAAGGAPASSAAATWSDGAPGGFTLRAFSSLQAAQADGDAVDTQSDEDVPRPHARHRSEEARASAVGATGAAAAAAASHSGVAAALPSGYESDVAGSPSAVHVSGAVSDGGGSGGHLSDASLASVLCHAAHKHRDDRAECILAHDWYSMEHDTPTWLLLVKWKHKPVAGTTRTRSAHAHASSASQPASQRARGHATTARSGSAALRARCRAAGV